MKLIYLFCILLSGFNPVVAQEDTLNVLDIKGHWTLKEAITSSEGYERSGNYNIRIDSSNNVWIVAGDSEIKKSYLSIKGHIAHFRWPYNEKFVVAEITDSSFMLMRTIEETIPLEEYYEMPYSRPPQFTRTTVSYSFTRRIMD